MKSDTVYIIDGKFEFNYSKKEIALIKDGGKRKLLTQASNILLHLIRNKLNGNNDVISQDDLFNVGWGEKKKFVTISTFYQNILLLRKAFYELDGQSDVIKNIPKKGYKLSDDIVIDYLSVDNRELSCSNNNSLLVRGKSEDEVKSIITTLSTDGRIKNSKKVKKILLFSRKDIKKIIIQILFIVLTITIIILYFNHQRRNSSLTNFTYCGTIKDKVILCNKKTDLDESLSQFISDEVISNSFSDYKYMYIMRRNFTNKLSIIYCMKELDSFSIKANECISYYIIDWLD